MIENVYTCIFNLWCLNFFVIYLEMGGKMKKYSTNVIKCLKHTKKSLLKYREFKMLYVA